MMAAKTSQALIDELQSLKDSIDTNGLARAKALNLAKDLTTRLTSPIENAIDIVFAPHIASAIHTAVRLGLFEAIAKNDTACKNSSITTSQLAAILSAEKLLINRILRMVSSLGYIAENGPDSWTATPNTHAIANPAIAAGHRFVWDIQVESVIKSPQFLKEIGWKSPVEPTDGFIQYAKRTKYDVFDYMANVEPDRLRDFHMFMGNTMGDRSFWADWYPVEKNILSGFDASPESALLVDVGGGKGHDLLAFATKFPQVPASKLVLQDISAALGTVQEKDSRITYVQQDFFKPNTIKGAKTYFMHHILHDWSDKYALPILKHLRDAMAPGYSKLLIHDLVLPNSGVTRYQAAWDLCMMTFNSGIERSRAQWEHLLQEAGLKLIGFYHGPDGEDADGIVEAMVA